MRALDLLRQAIEPAADPDPVDGLLDLAKRFTPNGDVAKRRTPDGTTRVRVDGLQTDHDYQRPLDREKVDGMIERVKAGGRLKPIKVNERHDGSQWITDGQHRVEVARQLGHTHIDAVVTRKPQQDEPQETNLVAKVSEDSDRDAIAYLLGAGGRRDGKRLVLKLGGGREVAYVPYATEWVAKQERGQLLVKGPDVAGVVERLGFGELSLESASLRPVDGGVDT